ncbi:hypothetical protein HPC49_32205 [Pyxidicoccus fallax]|uniref:Uncharacterized protein n=1 Tax=Pyxidicoccus fallax TaxID=394095 RepID=A0A848LUF8_9BACT|nr:hypothetical protein [Pyxidicoccus fallax]NMO21605.1 hypothetical protein [Pyxidicoccus fallax]NPC82875.1 hypothetical protein [Pyxidicoccus fallax]
MSNTNPDPRVPSEMPPDAPAELVAKRDRIIPELEKQAKAATGTLQQVMRKMGALISNTKPGAALDGRLYQDVKDAFSRHLAEAEKNPAIAAMPPILVESVEWMQAYLNARGFSSETSAAPAAAPAKAPAGKAPAAGAKDAFETSTKKHAALTGDVPPPPAQPLDVKKEQKELESFKAWMKNPSLGKLKG